MSGARAINRAALVALVAGALFAVGCGDDDAQGAGSGAGGGAVKPGGGGGRAAASASGGTHAGSGGGGQIASGGSSGANAGGTGGASTDAGTPACTAKCMAGQHCELVQVMCIRAPCPAQPSCVDDGAGGAGCGSRGLPQCAAGQFCNFPRSASCGEADAPGKCTDQSPICPDIYQPVCGCDGQTYANECVANAAGVSARSDGECGGGGGSSSNDCDPRKILCKRVAPECPDGQVPSVDGSCYGACIPIESCVCDAPEACPSSNMYTCHMAAGHCGPYV